MTLDYAALSTNARLWARQHGATPATEDDVAQEALIKLWRAEQRGIVWPTDADLYAYLKRCVLSALYDSHRKARRCPLAPLPAPYEAHPPALEVEAPAEPLGTFWDLVYAALGDDAPLVLRRYAVGERADALAAEAGLPMNDVYNRLRNGLGRLRRQAPALRAAYWGD